MPTTTFPAPAGSWRFLDGHEALAVLDRGVDPKDLKDLGAGMMAPSQGALRTLQANMTEMTESAGLRDIPTVRQHEETVALLQHNDARGLIVAFFFQPDAPHDGLDADPALHPPCVKVRVSAEGAPFAAPTLALRDPLMQKILDVQLNFKELVLQGLREWETTILNSITADSARPAVPAVSKKRL